MMVTSVDIDCAPDTASAFGQKSVVVVGLPYHSTGVVR